MHLCYTCLPCPVSLVVSASSHTDEANKAVTTVTFHLPNIVILTTINPLISVFFLCHSLCTGPHFAVEQGCTLASTASSYVVAKWRVVLWGSTFFAVVSLSFARVSWLLRVIAVLFLHCIAS